MAPTINRVVRIEAHQSKDKELVDNKDSHENEFQSMMDQLATLPKSLDAKRLAKEEANKAAEEHILQLQKKHDQALVNAKEEVNKAAEYRISKL